MEPERAPVAVLKRCGIEPGSPAAALQRNVRRQVHGRLQKGDEGCIHHNFLYSRIVLKKTCCIVDIFIQGFGGMLPLFLFIFTISEHTYNIFIFSTRRVPLLISLLPLNI